MDYNLMTFDENDKLERKTFAQNLTNILVRDNHSDESNSFVIALDSAWGTGKTCFLHMWKNLLKSQSGQEDIPKLNVLYYNAWENDDWNNAFIPLVYRLRELDAFGQSEKDIETLKQKAIGFAKGCGKQLLKDGAKKLIGENFADYIIDAFTEGIESASKTTPELFFENYETYLDEKKDFKDGLNDLIPPDSGKLVIFIDELDRCRPTFAIDTLEIVKHLFNVEGLSVIFAVDIEQLSYSVQTLYGVGMDASGAVHDAPPGLESGLDG